MDGNETGPGLAVPNSAHWVLLGVAVVLTLIVPVRAFPTGAPGTVSGFVLVAVGATLWVWGRFTLRRHHTTSALDRAPSTLVDEGPYRFSRNPTYLGLVVVFAGVGVAVNSAWLLALAAAEFILADRQARREEFLLESLFGATYANYRSRVRRWL